MNINPSLPRPLRIAGWIARITVAVILLQTLRFKFTGAPESVYIFETVGMEPWGRYGSGVVELLASLLLFVPGGIALGGLLAAGTMAGAIVLHLTTLGVVVQNDGGLLFGAAVLVFTASVFVVWLHRRTLPLVGARL